MLTMPIYPEPDKDRTSAATRALFRIVGYIAPGQWVKDSVLVRAAILCGATVAEATWALHELTLEGGFEVYWFRSSGQPIFPVGLITTGNLPAGLQITQGNLTLRSGSDCCWGELAFSPNHEKLEDIRRMPNSRRSNAAPANIERLASATKLFPTGIPNNPDIVDLSVRLNSLKDSGRSMNSIASDFTCGDEAKANSRLCRNNLSATE